MATQTRATVDAPEVDVVDTITINRIDGAIDVRITPSRKVMAEDGTTQAINPLGQPVHRRTSAPGYGWRVDARTPEGVERMVALEAGALGRIVGAVLVATGANPTEQDVVDLTTQLLQSGVGIDSAMTEEAEDLAADLFARWEELRAGGDSADVGAALHAEFGVYFNGPGEP